MKKMFFFALAAAGMLTACSNDDTLGGNGDQNVSEQPRFVSALLRLRFRPVVLVP